MRILGIESSADETGAAVVKDGQRLLSNVIASSLDLHQAYGGIVPEIAARSHMEAIMPTVEQALRLAGCGWDDIDAIAVTEGPGLIGSLLIGVLTARTLAIVKNKPLYGINHVEAHVYANFITEKTNSLELTAYSLNNKQPEFPILALIVSGGHTQIALFENHGRYRLLGQTLDDALGEAYDKVAKITGLPYPGGPSVDKAAKDGNPLAIDLPTARLDNPYDFSFSGLKTAVLRAAQSLVGEDYTFPSSALPARLNEAQKADLAASFQKVANKTVANALAKAAEEFQPKSIVLAGGVAASLALRQEIEKILKLLSEQGTDLDADGAVCPLLYPDMKLCTDNAAMIATLAFYQSKLRQPDDPYSLEPKPGLSM